MLFNRKKTEIKTRADAKAIVDYIVKVDDAVLVYKDYDSTFVIRGVTMEGRIPYIGVVRVTKTYAPHNRRLI